MNVAGLEAIKERLKKCKNKKRLARIKYLRKKLYEDIRKYREKNPKSK